MSGKHKTVRTITLPTNLFENRNYESGISVRKADDQNPDRFACTSTPSLEVENKCLSGQRKMLQHVALMEGSALTTAKVSM